MKDFLLRKDGLEKIKQKQFQEEKEMKSQEQVPYQPEFKKFFKNEQVQVDLREQTKIHQNFLEQKLREELLKSLSDGGEKALFEACLQKIKEEEEEKLKSKKRKFNKNAASSHQLEDEQLQNEPISISIPQEYINTVVREV